MRIRTPNGRHPFHTLRNQMDNVFEEFFAPLAERAGATALVSDLPVNVWEDNDFLFVEAELPGLQLEELELSVHGNELTLKTQPAAAEQNENLTWHRRERRARSVSRVLQFPVNIDAERVEATLRAGILTVKLPKAPEHRPHKIEVKGN